MERNFPVRCEVTREVTHEVTYVYYKNFKIIHLIQVLFSANIIT